MTYGSNGHYTADPCTRAGLRTFWVGTGKPLHNVEAMVPTCPNCLPTGARQPPVCQLNFKVLTCVEILNITTETSVTMFKVIPRVEYCSAIGSSYLESPVT